MANWISNLFGHSQSVTSNNTSNVYGNSMPRSALTGPMGSTGPVGPTGPNHPSSLYVHTWPNVTSITGNGGASGAGGGYINTVGVAGSGYVNTVGVIGSAGGAGMNSIWNATTVASPLVIQTADGKSYDILKMLTFLIDQLYVIVPDDDKMKKYPALKEAYDEYVGLMVNEKVKDAYNNYRTIEALLKNSEMQDEQ